MLATILHLALAIHTINPALPEKVAQEYARDVAHLASRSHLDPWLIVELVRTETRWQPAHVRHEHDGTCSVGLGQINGPCTPGHVARLLDPRRNLRRTAAILVHLRETLGGAEVRWLHGYNPGAPEYVPTILAAVRARHARP